jgi:hypothetical protein
VFDDRHFYDDLGHILSAYQTGEVSPGSTPGNPGSGDNRDSILIPLELFPGNGLPTIFPLSNPGIGSGGPFVPFQPPGNNLPPIPVQPSGTPPNPPSTPPAAAAATAAGGTALYLELVGAGKLEPRACRLESWIGAELAARHRRDSVRHVEL